MQVAEQSLPSRTSLGLLSVAAGAVQAVNAEVVVVLDGTTEHGDQFMSMRSYLPSEVHWGFTFVPIVRPAQLPSTRHEVDIGRYCCCCVPA